MRVAGVRKPNGNRGIVIPSSQAKVVVARGDPQADVQRQSSPGHRPNIVRQVEE